MKILNLQRPYLADPARPARSSRKWWYENLLARLLKRRDPAIPNGSSVDPNLCWGFCPAAEPSPEGIVCERGRNQMQNKVQPVFLPEILKEQLS